MNKFLLSSLLACCVLSSINAEAPLQKQTVTLEKYTNQDNGYTIEYPSDWKKNEVPQLDLVLFSPSKGNDETAHASLNIVSEKVGSEINLDKFYSESASNLASALKDVQIEKTGLIELNGTPSKWMLYTHIMQGFKFQVLQYFVVANDTIFLITFSSQAAHFDLYRQDFENIANSFKVTNPKPLISTPVMHQKQK